jgi:preprotein translocase subunit SecG
MENVVLVIHLFLALAIIGLVLLQRSEGGGLGIGGGSGGGAGNFASARGTANFLTRATGICAGLFFCTSLFLGIMAGQHTSQNKGILSNLDASAPTISEPAQLPDADTNQVQGTATPVAPSDIAIDPEEGEDNAASPPVVPANNADVPAAPIAE